MLVISAILGAVFGLGLLFMFLMYPASVWKRRKGEGSSHGVVNFIIRFHKCIGTIVLLDTILYLVLCFRLFPFSWMVLITMLLFILVAITGFFIKKDEKSSWRTFHHWGTLILLILMLLYTKIK